MPQLTFNCLLLVATVIIVNVIVPRLERREWF